MSAAERRCRPGFDLGAWVAESCAASGVPAKVEDEATLLKVAAMVLAARRAAGGAQREASAGR